MNSKPAKNRRKCILVLGMHRSGTSALTRLLNLLGIALPQTIMGAGVGNDAGHWEPQKLVNLNNKLLEEVRDTWDAWGNVDLKRLTPDRSYFYKSELAREIMTEYGDAPIFVIKDPRICRISSIYFEVLAEMEIDVCVILPFRNPIDVGASLFKRDGVAPTLTHLYWMRHVLDAEKASRHLPRFFIRYDDLLSNWTTAFEGLNEHLGLKLSRPSKSTQKEIESFLDPNLRNFSSTKIEKNDSDLTYKWIRQAYSNLEQLADDADAEKPLASFDRLGREFDQSTTLFNQHFIDLKYTLAESYSSNAELHETNQILLENNTVTHAELERTRNDLSTRMAELAALSIQYQSETELRTNLQNELVEKTAELEAKSNAQISLQVELQEKIASQTAELEDKNNTIDVLKNKLNRAIESHSNEIKRQSAEYEEAMGNLRQLRHELRQKSVELNALNESLATQANQTKEQEAQLEQQIYESQNTINQLTNELNAHANILKQSSVHIDNLTQMRDHALQRATHAEQDIEKFKSSTSWKVTKPLRSAKKIRSKFTEENTKKAISQSGLFDANWYESTYPDVKSIRVDSITHYIRFGAHEMRNPSPDFDTAWYVSQNADVAENQINPLLHYIKYGHSEGRSPSPPKTQFTLDDAQRKLFQSHAKTPLKVVAINQLEPSENTILDGRWNSTGSDPHFVFSINDGPLKSGTYLLSVENGAGSALTVNASVYPDYGKGISEETSIPLTFIPTATGWCACVKFPEPVTALRFDPSQQKGEINLGHLKFERISEQKYNWILSSSLIKNRIKSPGDVLRTVQKVGRSIKTGGINQIWRDMAITTSRQNSSTSYTSWVSQYDTLSASDIKSIQHRIDTYETHPVISIVVPVYNPPPALLIEAIESVIGQLYPHWELCLANDKSTDENIERILNEYAAKDSRIKVIHREQNGHISNATNSALELVTSEWVALLDHDDLLTPHALFHMVEAMRNHPDARLFYSDEDKINLDGNRDDPHFKSDFNIDLFYAYNMISHFGMYHKSIIDKIGGFRVGYEGAQDYDLALRYIENIELSQIVHIPHILYHWRVMPGSTAQGSDEKPYAMVAGEKALADHLARKNINAEASSTPIGYKVTYRLPQEQPLVSLIIPTRNAHGLVKQAVDSIFELTTYKNYEIILVDNGSDDPVSLAYFKTLGEDPRVTVIRDDSPFNYSALNNNAVAKCKGEVIALVNNDISVISPGWLDEMVSLALQPGVGAVGAMLYYPNDTIQHAGVVIGIGGVAGHLHIGFERGAYGYFSRAAQRQTLTAVTAACLVVTRENFERVNGLNENDLTVAFNDVDFCLKLHTSGLRNIWTPYAELYHHESATRGTEDSPEKKARFEKEALYMMAQWHDIIAHDPAYSPNLTLTHSDMGLAFPPRAQKPWL